MGVILINATKFSWGSYNFIYTNHEDGLGIIILAYPNQVMKSLITWVYYNKLVGITIRRKVLIMLIINVYAMNEIHETTNLRLWLVKKLSKVHYIIVGNIDIINQRGY